MSSNLFKLLEGLLFFGAVLGFIVYQIVSLRRDLARGRKERERGQEREEREQAEGRD